MMELKFALSEDQISLTRSRLLSLGIPLTGNSGTLTAKGITAEYEYGGGYLVVRVMKKPTLITNSLVKAKMEEWLGVKSV
jgi:hypothetical protein